MVDAYRNYMISAPKYDHHIIFRNFSLWYIRTLPQFMDRTWSPNITDMGIQKTMQQCSHVYKGQHLVFVAKVF